MMGFCGALNFEEERISFSMLKRMYGLHGAGCAYINREFGIMCGGEGDFDECSLQPVTVRYNNALYTAAIVAPERMRGMEGSTAQGVLEGYFEEGEEYIRRLEFPYALALYDSRCGELLLAKGEKGDKPLFYTFRDGTMYFATSLRPLFRLYGGCVRVNKKVLVSHISGEYSTIPEELFCDIRPIRPSRRLVCSRFGHTEVPAPVGVGIKERQSDMDSFVLPEYSKKTDMRRILTDSLFAFDYPQFDCFMPSLLPYVKAAAADGRTEVDILDSLADNYADYSLERAERIGSLYGVDVRVSATADACVSARELKAMEKQIDTVLSEYLQSPYGVSESLVSDELLDEIYDDKSVQRRIHRKGMLCQTAMWFECYNLVLV